MADDAAPERNAPHAPLSVAGGAPAATAAHEWGTAPELVGPRHELRERLLLGLLLSARPGRRVLNAGAGLGSFSALLEARGFDVTSTDVSRAALGVLRSRVRGPVVEADLTSLPFGGGSFDAVVLGEVLEHVSDDAGALREVRRVLVQGGVAALSVPAHPEWFGASDEWAGHVRRYRRQRLLEVLAGADLAVERLEPWGFPFAALYHRAIYDRRAPRLAVGPSGARPSAGRRLALGALRAALLVDRLFVGVERGALGYLALARTLPPA